MPKTYKHPLLFGEVTQRTLTRLPNEVKREIISQWFVEKFEPVRGDYLDEQGKPKYFGIGTAYEILLREFDQLVPKPLISSVAKELETLRKAPHWSPRLTGGPDRDDDELEDNRSLDDFAVKLESGAKVDFENAGEPLFRQDAVEKVERIREALDKLNTARGRIGHNQPPSAIADEDWRADERPLREIDALATSLSDELQRPEPDALTVCRTTQRLESHESWLKEKAELAANKAFESYGTEIGKYAAHATAILVGLIAALLLTLIPQLVEAVTGWLQAIVI